MLKFHIIGFSSTKSFLSFWLRIPFDQAALVYNHVACTYFCGAEVFGNCWLIPVPDKTQTRINFQALDFSGPKIIPLFLVAASYLTKFLTVAP